MATEFFVRSHIQALQSRVGFKLFPLGDNQRRGKFSFAPDYYDLIHEARCFDEQFDRLRRDILATGGLEQLLLPVCNRQISFSIETANVAGLEPAILSEDRARLFRFVPIAAHNVWAAGFNFTVSSNA